MTFEDAMRTLEVDRGSDTKAVRRAYLRKLKQHPPERDPEGFKQLRAAFELLSTGYWQFTESTVRDVPAFSSTAGDADAGDEVAPSNAEREPPTDDDTFNAEDDDLDYDESEIDVANVDVDECVERIGLDGASRWPSIAGALIASGRGADAARIAVAAYAREQACPFEPKSASYFGAQLALSLLSAGHDRLAIEVLGAFANSRDSKDGDQTPRTWLTSQLFLAAPGLADEAKKAIADALAEHNLEPANRYLADFALADPRAFVAASNVIRRQAPEVAALFPALSTGAKQPRFKKPDSNLDKMVVLLATIVVPMVMSSVVSFYDKKFSYDARRSHDSEARSAPARRYDEPFCPDSNQRPLCYAVRNWRESTDCNEWTEAASAVRWALAEDQKAGLAHKLDVSSTDALFRITEVRCGKLN